jgi:hypothetical protein
MISDHHDFYVPNLATFQNNNTYLGSFHGLRFKLTPSKRQVEGGEEGQEEPTLEALVWYGIFCLEKSQVVDEAVFPQTQEGYDQMIAWLDEQHQILMRQSQQDETKEVK